MTCRRCVNFIFFSSWIEKQQKSARENKEERKKGRRAQKQAWCAFFASIFSRFEVHTYVCIRKPQHFFWWDYFELRCCCCMTTYCIQPVSVDDDDEEAGLILPALLLEYCCCRTPVQIILVKNVVGHSRARGGGGACLKKRPIYPTASYGNPREAFIKNYWWYLYAAGAGRGFYFRNATRC